MPNEVRRKNPVPKAPHLEGNNWQVDLRHLDPFVWRDRGNNKPNLEPEAEPEVVVGWDEEAKKQVDKEFEEAVRKLNIEKWVLEQNAVLEDKLVYPKDLQDNPEPKMPKKLKKKEQWFINVEELADRLATDVCEQLDPNFDISNPENLVIYKANYERFIKLIKEYKIDANV